MKYYYNKKHKSYYYYKKQVDLSEEDEIILELLTDYDSKLIFLKKLYLIQKIKKLNNI